MSAQRSHPSPSESEIDQHGSSRKRARAAAACDSCTDDSGHRKQACSGGEPCDRCQKDDRACTYGERDPKTALTRARMTELESRLESLESMWSVLFPDVSLDEAIRQSKTSGPEVVYQRLGLGRASHPPIEIQRTAHRSLHLGDSIPPSRAASPERLDAFWSSTHRSYGWDEGGTEPTQLADGGMGSLIHGKGLSYHGLSSAAVYLSAIEKLCPVPVGSGLQDALTWFSALNNGSLAWEDPLTAPDSNVGLSTSAMLPSDPFAIPPWAEIGPFVESYFRYFHPLTPIVHEPTIRAQISGAVPMPAGLGNTVLLNMIFAIGALDCGTSATSPTGDHYYRAARRALQRGMLDGGSLALVQGVAIMSNYLQRSGKPNAGYMCLGWASRMAMSLGLHLGSGSDANTSTLDGEMRLRVWWCVVTLEAGCAVTFGRPHPAGAYQLDGAVLPVNCDDEHLTVSTAKRPDDRAHLTLYSSLLYQSRLARVTCAILDRVLHSHSALTVAQLRQFDSRISRVRDKTDPSFFNIDQGRFQLSRAVQNWRTKDFRAMLYRPLLLGAAWGFRGRQVSEDLVEAINICRSISIDTLSDIGAFVANYNDVSRCFEWYTVFFALQASLTLLLSCLSEPQHVDVALWHQMLKSTAQWFRQMTTMATPALAFADLIDAVMTSQVSRQDGNQPFIPQMEMPPPDDMAMTFDMDRFLMELNGDFTFDFTSTTVPQ